VITIAVTKLPKVTVIYKQHTADGAQEVRIELNAATLTTDLGPALQRARSASPQARVVVKMDKGAHYGIVADMVAGLQQANATRFNVQTNLKQGAGQLTGK
jgi:biopolymer transport protein ExbD